MCIGCQLRTADVKLVRLCESASSGPHGHAPNTGGHGDVRGAPRDAPGAPGGPQGAPRGPQGAPGGPQGVPGGLQGAHGVPGGPQGAHGGAQGAGVCQACNCRPMWCSACMARWFAARQALFEQPTDSWLAQRAPCPTCRATFCIRDVCRVHHSLQ